MPMTMGPAARAAPRQRRPPSLAAAATTAAVVACTAALLAASTSSSSSSSSTSSSLSFFAWADVNVDALPPTAGDAAAAAETVATAGAIKASTAKTTALPRTGAGCPSYGCPLRPVDVHYDEGARDALAALRKLLERRDNGESEASDSSNDGDGGDASASSIDDALSHLRSSGHDGAATLTLIGYKGGRLEDQINQDRAFVVSPFYLPASTSGNNDEVGSSADSIDGDNPTEEEGEARDDIDENERDGGGSGLLQLLGVFDGHARLGEHVSEHAVSELPRLLSSKLVAIGSSREDSVIEMDNSNDSDSDSSSSSSSSSWEDGVKKALIETFIELDQTAPASISGGCTASVVLRYGPDHIFVANSGDSQSFVVTHVPSTGDTRIVYESREDKPHLPDERSRIESMGGKVQMPRREGGTSRVLHVDHTTGQQFGLAMSRSIGDWDAAKVGVVPDPIVDALYLPSIVSDAVAAARGNGSCAVEIDAGGEASVDVNDPACHEGAAANVSEEDVQVFAVSATDGLLDFLSTDLVASHLAKSLYGGGADSGDEDDDDDESGAGAQRHPLVACDDLVRAAAHGWQEAKGGRYRDDIAIAVSRIDVAPGRR